VHRDGLFVARKTRQAKGVGVLVEMKREHIDTVLDLVFGTKRDKMPVLNKFGQTEFLK